ncbi:MAG: TolC family protein [Planctomycetota bacterium]
MLSDWVTKAIYPAQDLRKVCLGALCLGALGLISTGCRSSKEFAANVTPETPSALDAADEAVKTVSYEIEPAPITNGYDLTPFNLDLDPGSVAYWDLTLDEAIQYALANSTVLREIGAGLLQSPDTAATVYDPSITATDGRFGEEAALSAFDAQFNTRLFYERNDRALNNQLLGGGTNIFLQDLWRLQSEVSKTAAGGTQIAVRHNVDDDLNNAPQNIYGTSDQSINAHAWTWNLEAEVRQPLLQGSGTEFNRIAGPDSTPGAINGVLVARVNTSISAADFQLALRNYLSDVENAYWELVFAYRDLDAKKAARDRALTTWRKLKDRQKAGVRGAEDDKVAQAEEQYFRFKQDVETALSGVLLDGTRKFNGSTGGTFQGTGGVYVAERRLRLILGAPITDGRLIRPATEPQVAAVVFDWNELVGSAVSHRTELLQQRLRIKKRRLELAGNRNFLLPQFDLVGRYRRRGLGDHLYDPKAPLGAGGGSVDTGTDEWQVGVEMNIPIGYRRAYSAVRNSELALAREMAVYDQLERQVVHNVSNAIAEQARLYRVIQTAYNRRAAAHRQFTYLNSKLFDDSPASRRLDYNLLLDSQRRLADAELAYFRASVGYAVALKNVNLETENLLAYCNVHIAGAHGE